MQMEYDAAFIEAAKQSSIEFSRKELGQEIYVIRETHNYLFFGPVRKDEKNTAFFAALYLFKKKMHLQPGQKVSLYDHEGEFGVALVGQAQNRQVWVWLLSFDTNEIVKKSISLVHAVTGVQSPEELQICKDALMRYEKRSSRKRMERSLHSQPQQGAFLGSPLAHPGSPFSGSISPATLSPSTSLSHFSSLSLDSPLDANSPNDSAAESPSRTPLSVRRLRSQGRSTRDEPRKRTRRFNSKDSASDDEEEEEEEIDYDSDEEEAEDEHDIIEDSEEFVAYGSGSPRDGRSPRSPRRTYNNRNRRNTLSPIKKREINNNLNKKENMRMFMKLLEYVLTITENPDAEEDDK